MEELGDDVKLVAEQFGDVRKTLDEHTTILNRHGEMITQLRTDVTGLRKDVTELREDVDIIKGDVSFIKNALKAKVDTEEFAALERRVAALEKKSGH